MTLIDQPTYYIDNKIDRIVKIGVMTLGYMPELIFEGVKLHTILVNTSNRSDDVDIKIPLLTFD